MTDSSTLEVLAGWAVTYAASGLPVVPLHWITEGAGCRLLDDLITAAVSAGLDEHSARTTATSAARTVRAGAIA